MSLFPRHCPRCGGDIPGDGIHDCDESRAERELWAALRGLGTITFKTEELLKLRDHEDVSIASKAEQALEEYEKLYDEKLPGIEEKYGHIPEIKLILKRLREDRP